MKPLMGVLLASLLAATTIGGDETRTDTHHAVCLLVGHDLTETQYKRLTDEFANAFPQDRQRFKDVSNDEFFRRIVVELLRQRYNDSRAKNITAGELDPSVPALTATTELVNRESLELFGEVPK